MTTKIQLSAAEMELMCDAGVILTKNAVMQKTKGLLEAVQLRQLQAQKEWETFFPEAVFAVPPKIARGEAYEGLPWLMLDFPRLFTPTDTFAIRSFFWWGRYFSCTLQLSGIYKTAYEKKLQAAFHQLALQHLVGINPDPWQHHFGPDNYQPISQTGQKGFETFLTSLPHLKIASRIELANWPDADDLLFKNWQHYLSLLVA